ncbi:MAG: GNAT family N-acetyltransferase [Clostridia bacterium]|nr:GNAT family N-acetyltransferase [Clostridia bacterium]
MEIRRLTREDLPSLIALYAQLSDRHREMSLPRTEEVWDTVLKDDPNIVYLGAVDRGRVVSTCYLVVIPTLVYGGRPFGLLENVVTDAAYRRQGLAAQLIREAAEIARERGCYKLVLQSGVQRTGAHRFYEQLGFDGDRKRAFVLDLDEG